MATVNEDIRYLGKHFQEADNDAWDDHGCPNCGAEKMVRIAFSSPNIAPLQVGPIWLRCPRCRRGSVIAGGSQFPPRTPLRTPMGLPPLDQKIWEEVRACLSVGASVAAVMLCRKLLFHIAVAHGLAEKNDKDRAPTYSQAVSHLEEVGIITARMLPWVERIKDVGNDANHELSPVPPEQALDVATFTEQLLILAYELDALMSDPTQRTAEDQTT